MSLSKLDDLLSAGAPPLLLLLGDASLLVSDGVKRCIRSVLPHVGLPAFNHSTFRASEPGAVGALSAARTLPMMAERRLVVLLDVEEGSEELYGALLDYVLEPSSTTVLVVAGSKFPAAKKGQKAWGTRIANGVKKRGAMFKLENKSVRPAHFVQERAKAAGKSMGSRDASLLVELVGTDLARLAHEVDKLCLYVGEVSQISSDDVHAACSLLAEAVIWDLTAGLAARDADGALGALHRLLEEGDAPHRLLSMVMWQYRSLLVAAELFERGATDEQIRKQSRMRWDTFKQLKPVLQRGFPAPERMLARLARANRDMNSRRAGDRRVLEALVVDLVAA